MIEIWNKLFLDERPSIGLSFFRIFAALTTGLHVIPSLIRIEDNYFSTAFKGLNGNFFPGWILEFVQRSPEPFIVAMAVLFCISCFFFLIGLFSQFSCIVMTMCCYYFYALNSFQIGTLSWDILLVTLFLMCVTPYHGDYFSVDCLFKKGGNSYKTRRPIFLQRLLQLQLASTFFYTALYKTTAQGNWLQDNPVYYLMNGPASGVIKHFLLREWMAGHPGFCYFTGLFIVSVEFLMPVLLFYPKTRVSAIYAGILFHILLILTMDVPAIFFFLFPAQFLLFINPESILEWIEKKRAYHQSALRPKLIYDGRCGFCLETVRKLRIMDLFNRVDFVDFRVEEDVSRIHPQLNSESAASQIHLVENGWPHGDQKELHGGFFAMRRLCLMMPMLYPAILVLFFPGAGILGPWIYRWVAKNRFLLHNNRICVGNACYR